MLCVFAMAKGIRVNKTKKNVKQNYKRYFYYSSSYLAAAAAKYLQAKVEIQPTRLYMVLSSWNKLCFFF